MGGELGGQTRVSCSVRQGRLGSHGELRQKSGRRRGGSWCGVERGWEVRQGAERRGKVVEGVGDEEKVG
jgi:hypothetical protein